MLRAALLIALAALPTYATAAAPRRIVSLNLCADQLVIALADRAQIVGLTRYARDPAMSFYAARAAALPAADYSAEQVLLLKPDLVIGMPWGQRDILTRLTARGTALVDLPPAESLPAIEGSVRLIAAAVGHPERGVRLIATMRAQLARVGTPGRGRSAAYYQRRGYLTGTGTLVDEIMRRVGLTNLAHTLGTAPLARLPLERLVVARPDFLVLESAAARVADQGTELLHHPLLDRAVPPAHHLYIPEAMTVCGGPSYPHAVALLAARIRAADAGAPRLRNGAVPRHRRRAPDPRS